MRVAIIGVGAMGCLFGARLAPHAQVEMLGNWREAVDAIRKNGIILESNEPVQTVPAFASQDTADIRKSDLAIIARKSWQTESAAEQAAQVLARDGIALTVQNGLGNLEKIARVVGARRTGLMVTTLGATVTAPGKIRLAGSGATYIGANSAARAQLELIAALFEHAGLETHLAEDVQAMLWSKLAVNCGINALTALLNIPNGGLVTNPDAEELMVRAARECAGVARAQGIAIDPASVVDQVRQVAHSTATNSSSMLQDRLRGAPTEIDAINGAVAQYGAQLGVPTPTNELLWRLVRVIANLDPEPHSESLQGKNF